MFYLIDFLTVIENLTAKKISVYILQNGLETQLPNGQPNPIAQLVMGILAQFNSMECSDEGSLFHCNRKYFVNPHLFATEPTFSMKSEGVCIKKEQKTLLFCLIVRVIGLEPTRRKTPDPKSGASTNFATRATVPAKVVQKNQTA